MKRKITVLFLLCIFIILFAACDSQSSYSSDGEIQNFEESNDENIDGSMDEYEDEYEDELDYYSLLEWVDSTCFSAVGYDEYNEILVVEFLDEGSIYAYYDVPEYEYWDLVNADSIGGYYNDYIKGQYYSERLE